jgi:hypothetical protein
LREAATSGELTPWARHRHFVASARSESGSSPLAWKGRVAAAITEIPLAWAQILKRHIHAEGGAAVERDKGGNAPAVPVEGTA